MRENDSISPNFLMTITYEVFADDRLNPRQKLLYALINSLTQSKGYCYASNDYLCKEMKCSLRSLKDDMKTLEECKHVFREVIRDPKSNEVKERRIYTDLSYAAKKKDSSLHGPQCKTCTEVGAEVAGTSVQSLHRGHSYSSTKNTHSRNTIADIDVVETEKKPTQTLPVPGRDSVPLSGSVRNEADTDPETDRMFDEFWDKFPSNGKKEYRSRCRETFGKVPNLGPEFPRIMKGLEILGDQIACSPSAYLRGQKWEEVVDKEVKREQDYADNREKLKDVLSDLGV